MNCKMIRQTDKQTGRRAESIIGRAGCHGVLRGLTLRGQSADHRLHAPGSQVAGTLYTFLISIAHRGHQGVGFFGAVVGLLEALTGPTHHRQLKDSLEHILLLLSAKKSVSQMLPPPINLLED